jgi:hypothetical protein
LLQHCHQCFFQINLQLLLSMFTNLVYILHSCIFLRAPNSRPSFYASVSITNHNRNGLPPEKKNIIYRLGHWNPKSIYATAVYIIISFLQLLQSWFDMIFKKEGHQMHKSERSIPQQWDWFGDASFHQPVIWHLSRLLLHALSDGLICAPEALTPWQL